MQESTVREVKLALIDEEGVFLETDPASKSVEDSTSELEGLTEALTEANQRNAMLSEELDNTAQLLEEERKRNAEFTKKLAEYEKSERHSDPGKVEKLKTDLREAKDKAKQMWKLSCSQSREQEEQIPALEAELAILKASKSKETSSASSSLSGRSSPIIPEPETVPVRPTRRGKAPPVDPFTGEDPTVKPEDWIPVLKRASIWNGWSQEEELIQLAGHVRGKAL